MLSWVPRRRGEIYCSPACGRGCTWAEYQAALAEAEKAVAVIKKRGRLSLVGVKVDVFENLGWHWALKHLHFGLYPTNGGRFSILMAPFGREAGLSAWDVRDRVSYAKADLLVSKVLAVARAQTTAFEKCCDAVESLLDNDRELRYSIWLRVVSQPSCGEEKARILAKQLRIDPRLVRKKLGPKKGGR